jgi:S-adenosylmethionine/arginine decarboxylase-like enzyme
MEMETCPEYNDKHEAAKLIKNIIRDLHMRLLDKPHVYYVKVPTYNEGLTAISPIQTSHIAFHFWKNPERKILHQAESKCLLEFDIYTCGNLTIKQIHLYFITLQNTGPHTPILHY